MNWGTEDLRSLQEMDSWGSIGEMNRTKQRQTEGPIRERCCVVWWGGCQICHRHQQHLAMAPRHGRKMNAVLFGSSSSFHPLLFLLLIALFFYFSRTQLYHFVQYKFYQNSKYSYIEKLLSKFSSWNCSVDMTISLKVNSLWSITYQGCFKHVLSNVFWSHQDSIFCSRWGEFWPFCDLDKLVNVG